LITAALLAFDTVPITRAPAAFAICTATIRLHPPSLAQAAEAHKFMESRQSTGKLVLIP
jgi:hypothetical protein